MMNFSAIYSVVERGEQYQEAVTALEEGKERNGATEIHAGAGDGGRDQAETTGEGRSRSELLRAERRGANLFPAGRKRELETWREHASKSYPWE